MCKIEHLVTHFTHLFIVNPEAVVIHQQMENNLTILNEFLVFIGKREVNEVKLGILLADRIYISLSDLFHLLIT